MHRLAEGAIDVLSALLPSKIDKAPRIMLLPAPVSPVITENPD